MKFPLVDKLESFNGAGGPTYGTAIKVSSIGGDSISVQCTATVAASTAKTFLAAAVDITADTITIASHGFVTGRIGQVSNPGTLPTGIAAVTNYYVIYVDADTIKLATSLALAQAGTAVDITAQGAGTNTFTPTALAGGTVGLYESNDNVTYTAVTTPTSIAATSTVMLKIDRPPSAWYKIGIVTTAGQLNTVNYILVKGDKAE